MIMAAEEDDDAAEAADEVDEPSEDTVTCLEEVGRGGDGPIASVLGGRPAAMAVLPLPLLLLLLLFFAEPLFFDDRDAELPNDATELLDDIRIMPGILDCYELVPLCFGCRVLSGFMPSAICV